VIQTSFIDNVTRNILFIKNEYTIVFLNYFLLCYFFYNTVLLRFVLFGRREWFFVTVLKL